MHALDFLKDPASIPLKPLYAVYGDDTFLRREALREIRRAALPGEDDELSVARFAGAEAKLADVLDELQTLPFFSKRRVVIVEEGDTFVSAHRRELEAYAERPASSGVLILSTKLWPSAAKLSKSFDKTGLAVECKGPQERQLVPWLVHLARSRYEVKLDEDAARLLVELVGGEVGLLVSDVEKLSVYVGDRGKVHREDVARMVGAGRIETVWKVLEAATTGKGALALEHLDGLVTAGEHPVGLLSAMTASLLKIYHAGTLRKRRVDVTEACRIAGIPTSPFVVEQTKLQHAHLGPSRVDRLPEMLLKADLDMKGSSMLPARAVLERLIVELAGPRRD